MTTATLTTPAPPVTKPVPVQLPAFDHLSWSGIETYKQCPAKFGYRYLEHAPPEFTPSSLAFGSAFHCVFEHVQQARLEGLPVPNEGELLDAFDFGWQDSTKGGTPVKFNKGEDLDSLQDLAVRMISSYRAFALSEPLGGCIVAVEEEERFRLLPDVPPIEMRLDLAEIRGDDLVVADLKTAKSSWNEQKAKDNLPQLVLYSVGLMPLVRDLGVKRVVPRFIVVTKAKAPKVQIIEPKATQDDVQKLRHRVADTWAAVQAGIFVKHEGWQCSQCPYNGRCQRGQSGG